MKELNEAIKLIEKKTFKHIEFDFKVDKAEYEAKVYRITDKVIGIDIKQKDNKGTLKKTISFVSKLFKNKER